VLTGASEFKVPPSIPFSTSKNTAFYKAAMEVMEVKTNLTDEQREIANFWNDNPVLTNYHGHFVFGLDGALLRSVFDGCLCVV
jgi:hypothetical protein